MDERIQVVLGEAEPDSDFLRFVLEGEGFDLIGLATSDEELEVVLEGAQPSVIVLDGAISATAALEAKERAPGSSLVVVWPEGVASVLADERVEPGEVVDELGAAVRRAAERARVPEPPTDVVEELGAAIREWRATESILAPVGLPDQEEPEEPVRKSRRGTMVLALTWILILTVLATIAVGVPNAVDIIRGP
jgi:hypothetical protein